MLRRTPWYLCLCPLVLDTELLGYIADMLSRMIILICPFISRVRVRVSEQECVRESNHEGERWRLLVLSHFSSVQLFATPMDCSLPGSSVHGILWAAILEWVAMSSSRGFSQPRNWNQVSCIAGGFFTTEPPVKPKMKAIMGILKLYFRGQQTMSPGGNSDHCLLL